MDPKEEKNHDARGMMRENCTAGGPYNCFYNTCSNSFGFWDYVCVLLLCIGLTNILIFQRRTAFLSLAWCIGAAERAKGFVRSIIDILREKHGICSVLHVVISKFKKVAI